MGKLIKKILFLLFIVFGLQSQAQINYCDSVSYTTTSTINFPLILSGSIPNIPGTVTWDWQVCNANMCYSSSGANASFGQVLITDTLKVCYNIIIDISGFTYTCSGCDSLVYNPNSYQWEPIAPQPLGVKELIGGQMGGQMYDLLGREIFEIPIGTVYIKNRKKYIR